MIKVISAAIIKNNEDKILALKLKKAHVGNKWVPPGGKLKLNETARECLKRELKEELGIEVKIKKLAGITEERYPDGYWVFILYEAEIIKGIPKKQEPDKILECSYVSRKKLKHFSSIKWCI